MGGMCRCAVQALSRAAELASTQGCVQVGCQGRCMQRRLCATERDRTRGRGHSQRLS